MAEAAGVSGSRSGGSKGVSLPLEGWDVTLLWFVICWRWCRGQVRGDMGLGRGE